ncbi:antibiotic biosynthesis monooxygenase [Desulfovibrio sp. OttesenSCG-928-M14]|nr:antibiotic biosynthesis monooxygenase [Desulfovibrio sp. OttesenSCG-928-M14]
MHALSVFFEIDPQHITDFKEAALAHAANSLGNEPGCLAFEIFQAPDNPVRFFFYECYTDLQALEEVHNKAAYFAEFGPKVSPWVVRWKRSDWTGVKA